jgi:hypothetical protein
LFCLALSKNLTHALFAKKADVVSRRKIKLFFCGAEKGPEAPAFAGGYGGQADYAGHGWRHWRARDRGASMLSHSATGQAEKSRDELSLTMGFRAACKTLFLFS